MARNGLLLLFAALFMAGPVSARFLLGNTPSPATHPLVTFLQQVRALAWAHSFNKAP